LAKRNIGHDAFTLPMSVAILGTLTDGRVNYMPVAWLTRVNYRPPMVGISVNKVNHSCLAVRENRQFSLNFPTREMLPKTDCAGLISGKYLDKSNLFPYSFGELAKAPLIEECPLAIECVLVETLNLPTNQFYVGEIKGVHADETILTDGMPDIEKLKPVALSMPDNRYWLMGACVGQAWKEGKELRDLLLDESVRKGARV
jgi:flavin reductase (DIM6/NTAB) family NADH-FMN oxidoreductase RutF